MRIVGGIHGGQRLIAPRDKKIRPTSDKVRGAIFNMIGSRMDLEGVRVLDAFCGSGALGLEALSRGAEFCSFYDISRTSLALARENAAHLGCCAQCVFQKRDATRLSTQAVPTLPFDLVFLDPPYGMDMDKAALRALLNGAWLRDGAVIICEDNQQRSDLFPAHYTIEGEKTYGETIVTVLRYNYAGI